MALGEVTKRLAFAMPRFVPELHDAAQQGLRIFQGCGQRSRASRTAMDLKVRKVFAVQNTHRADKEVIIFRNGSVDRFSLELRQSAEAGSRT
jgi:hypothetical protein